jgi:outer membrane receptor protein involved in Fe transport
MLYARIASGYGPGGANLGDAVQNGAPASYEPQYSYNYELGIKGDFFDHTLSLDASVYYIDWQKLQLAFTLPPAQGSWSYVSNGSRAKSEGVELSVGARPWRGMTISSWVDFDDAVITESPPPGSTAVLYPGERLPGVSRWSASAAGDQQFPLGGSWNGTVGANVSYVDARFNVINSSFGPAVEYPPYTKVDLRAAAIYEDWTLRLYANNVTDKRGIVGGGSGYWNPAAIYYIQPRTIGLSLVRKF